MQNIHTLTQDALATLKDELVNDYEDWRARGLRLDMSRGKPSPAQLELSMGMLDTVSSTSGFLAEDGTDVRNYGMLEGLAEARRFFGELLETDPARILIGGVSSLNLMYDCIVRALLLGVHGGAKPWSAQGTVKFICPVPGYDRHFAICEQLGIEMINVALDENGPDMETVERLVASDAAIKGIWCVPKYGNPTGCVYSDEVVRRFARLKPAADDFRIFWDNAYFVHDLDPAAAPRLLNLLAECEKAGNPDLAYEFCSTSKISFSGSGLSALSASANNIEWNKRQMGIQTIGFDKVNQLRHVRFFKDKEHLTLHMAAHAAIIRPKFEAVLETFEAALGGLGIAEWTKPQGGYFISVNVLPGCAKRVVELCKEAGVVLTGAGAAFPYGKDPEDSNIRIAPTYPSPEDLALAARLFCLCVRLAAVEKLLAAGA